MVKMMTENIPASATFLRVLMRTFQSIVNGMAVTIPQGKCALATASFAIAGKAGSHSLKISVKTSKTQFGISVDR